MPLNLNLLHEEHKQLQERARDPLKLGLYALGGIAALFALYYGWRVVSVGSVQRELAAKQAEWKKEQPQAAAAEKREKEINAQLAIAAAVGHRVEGRFYWAPVLDQLFRAVSNNVQLISFSGGGDLKDEKVKVALEGMAAGTEPRAAAEQFRLAVTDRLGKTYPGATATFRNLEEAVSSARVDGKSLPTARFTIDLELKKPNDATTPPSAAAASAAPDATSHRHSS